MWSQQLSGPGTFELIDVPAPTEDQLEDGDVLLRVLAGAVCGSDLPAFRGQLSFSFPRGNDYPRVAAFPGFPMHEVVGEVVTSRHPDVFAGQRVVGWATNADALSESIITRGDSVQVYDPSLRPTEAVSIQPLACVLFTIGSLPQIAGRRVAVIGQGPIGLLFSHAAKSAGAAHVTGVDRVDRSDVSEAFGIDTFLHSSSDRWAANISDDERPDVIIEAVGHQSATLSDAINAAALGATIYYFGVPDEAVYPLPINTLLRRRLTLTSGTVQDRRKYLAAANDYLVEHRELAASYVTNVFPWPDTQQAYATAVSPARGQLKIVLDMDLSPFGETGSAIGANGRNKE